MKYRAEIDGLRAVAVIPVILFHLDVPFFTGGYVGVDVFFVISGYLITQSLLVDEGFGPAARLARFYERRIRRILPALATVVAATLAAGVVWFLPSQLVALSKSAVATALFASNVWFWSLAGYFGGAADMMPLLHTWSLAVEEQFYIGFPLLIIALAGHRRAVAIVLVTLTLLSFSISIYLTAHSPSVAFYWPTRAWELLVGSLLTLVPRKSELPFRQLASSCGLGLIAFAVFTFDRSTPFPGVAALAPVVGSAAIIYGGGSTLVGQTLSLRPLVFVGLISYSLYLWHWPIIVFMKQRLLGRELNLPVILASVALTAVLAYLTWRFVETPFRRRGEGRRILFVKAGAVVAVGISVGLGLAASKGLPGRFDSEALSLATATITERPAECMAISRFVCKTGRGDPSFVLWGDSHAGAISSAVAAAASEPGLFATFNACPPLTYLHAGLKGADRENCATHTRGMMARLTDLKVKTVILAGFWSSYQISEAALREFLDAAKGKRVIIIGDNPTPGFNVPLVLALGGEPSLIVPAMPPPAFRVINEYPNALLINLSDAMCAEQECPAKHGTNVLYADGNHVSAYAAREIVSPFLKGKLF